LTDDKRNFIIENLNNTKKNHEIYKKLLDFKDNINFDEVLKKTLTDQ
jgi:hypothetical protein